MAQARLETIHRGWKVYAGAEQVGQVSEIREHDFDVRRGVLRKHTYALPAEFVADASDGIVDLNVDREVVEEREIMVTSADQMPEERERY